MKPVFNAHNPETSLAAYTHYVNDSEASKSSYVPHVVLNNFANTQNQPLCVPPTSEVSEDMQLLDEDMMQVFEVSEDMELSEYMEQDNMKLFVENMMQLSEVTEDMEHDDE